MVLHAFPFAFERIAGLEERLVEWNEFAAENLGRLAERLSSAQGSSTGVKVVLGGLDGKLGFSKFRV